MYHCFGLGTRFHRGASSFGGGAGCCWWCRVGRLPRHPPLAVSCPHLVLVPHRVLPLPSPLAVTPCHYPLLWVPYPPPPPFVVSVISVPVFGLVQ